MDKTLSFEIITPEKLVMKDQAESIVVPAYEGQLGIWPDHAPLLVELTQGELKITQNGEPHSFAISGGYVEVMSNEVKVFAETAEMEKEIDVERARIAAEKAKLSLTKFTDPAEIAKAQASLSRALIRLRISEGLKRRQK